jgi:outer membrane lipoprotein-sorting protein
MRADQLLKEMCAKYAYFTSYSDEGTVVVKGDQPARVLFRTHFQRPYLFRFEWTHMFRDRFNRARTFRNVLWCDGASTFLCGDDERPGAVQSLVLGVAGATGVSMGAAHTISAMLLKEVGGFLFTDLEQVSLSETVSDATDLYYIEGYHPAGDFCKLSLGKDDLLLRQVEMTDEAGLVTIETHSNIRVDEPIDGDIFQNAPCN